MDFTYPIDLSFKCSKCGLCCGDTKRKTRHILLLETEAQKISQKTSLAKSTFSTEIKDKQPYLYEMKKSSDRKCAFLKEGQCTIYELRPLICIFYPFELKFDPDSNQNVFDFTLECPGINQGKPFAKKDFAELFEIAEERLR